MRDNATPPQLPHALASPAPVMRATAAESLAASVATPSVKKRPRRKSSGYTSFWGVTGLLAAAYVGAVLVGQEPVTTMAGRWTAQDRDTTEIAAALARTQSEVAQLQRNVGALEADMNRAKVQVTQVDERERSSSARIDAVESRVERIGAQIAQVFAKGTLAQKTAVAAAPIVASRSGASIETSALPPKETPPAQRELAATRRAAPEPVVTTVPSAPQAAILLARGPSLDALRLSWSLLNERHKSSLGALEPRVVTSEPGAHQLVAGPFASAADAAKACATLKSRGVSCQPAEFKGEGL